MPKVEKAAKSEKVATSSDPVVTKSEVVTDEEVQRELAELNEQLEEEMTEQFAQEGFLNVDGERVRVFSNMRLFTFSATLIRSIYIRFCPTPVEYVAQSSLCYGACLTF